MRLMNHHMLPGSAFTNALKGSCFRLPLPTIEDQEWAQEPPVLSFSEEEEARGQELLREMGIPEGAWFVCFHARDSAYLTKRVPNRDLSLTDCRNCSIENYVAAMRYIVSCGGYAVRVGAVVSERMPDPDDSRIIDYASDYRSDFGDIYLLAKCKFFVGSNSGLYSVPVMFNVPIVDANNFVMPIIPPDGPAEYEPVEFRAFNRRDMFLPKPVFSAEKARLLTLREVLESKVRYFDVSHKFEECGLEALENSSDDILLVTKEMNDRLDGHFAYTDEDETLQTRLRYLARADPKNFAHLPRIGADFLRSHRKELD